MKVSIVVPVYNEVQALPELHARLVAAIDALPHSFDIWYVDDGSTDETATLVRKWVGNDPRVRLIELSRNFGHQAALSAGLDFAEGDMVITMDGDGQHPPELIGRLIELHLQGYDIVLTQRADDEALGKLKRLTSATFYWLINALSETSIVPRSADFRLLSRQVVSSLRQFHEYHRFLRGLISWMGYRWTLLSFQSPARIAGKPKYTWRRMFGLAKSAIFSFSTVPMQIAIVSGLALLMLALIQIVFVLLIVLLGQRSSLAPGWASLMLGVLGIGGLQLVLLGLQGYYIGMIFQETKRRPLYLLRRAPLIADELAADPVAATMPLQQDDPAVKTKGETGA